MSDDEEIEVPQAQVTSNSGILSTQSFSDLAISDSTKAALSTLGFVKMTHIQSRSIPESRPLTPSTQSFT